MTSLLSSIFTGKYNFSRYISVPAIDMRGIATYSNLSSNSRHYHEEGSYTLGGNAQDFYQNQLFIIHENQFSIFKSTGGLLHKFTLPKKIAFPIHVSHLYQCSNDQYILDFWIQPHGRLMTVYRILGPHKNYTITTSFSRTSLGK